MVIGILIIERKVEMRDFIKFIRKQGVIGLAVGFILGGAVSKVVTALIEDIVNPILSVILGAADGIADATLKIGDVAIKWGDFLSVTIDFLVLAAVVYFLVTGLKLDRLDYKEEDKK